MNQDSNGTVLLLSFLSVFSLLTFGAVCSSSSSDGGVFKSVDRGQTWEQKSYAGQSGRRVLSISALNMTVLTQNSQNNQQLFLGTEDAGLWYSGNAGDQWGPVSQINSGKVRAVVFDPFTPTTIFVLRDNQVIKTTDGGTTWETVYTETSGKVIVTLLVHPQQTHILYAGLENGKVLQSTDGGVNWSVILSEAHQPITRIVINQNSPNIIFALELDKELWRTLDGGVTWQKLYDYDYILQVRGTGGLLRLSQDQQHPETLYLIAENVGLIRTDDNGDHWTKVDTLVGRDVNTISAFQVDPLDSQTLWMGVGHFIHVSYNRGETWAVIETFPSTRQIVFFTVDAQHAQVIYAGTKAEPKKGGLLGPR